MATQEPTPTGISPEDYCFFMSVDSECSKLTVTDTPDIKTSQTFMFLSLISFRALLYHLKLDQYPVLRRNPVY